MSEALHILATGLNHKTAPVEVRERIAFQQACLDSALSELTSCAKVEEAVILSTCNRAELYCISSHPEESAEQLGLFFGEFHGLDPGLVQPHLYHHLDGPAARHLFCVAAGIDSMVLGESEILSQVKQALQFASEVGTSHTVLNELFQRSLHIGKRARTETAIHRGIVSVPSAAVELAESVFEDLQGRQVLIIGAGEMSAQTLKHLVGHGVESVVVANRTYQRAAELAAANGGQAITFDDFPAHLEQADIVVASSAAPHAIITVDKLRPRLAARRGRPLFIIDIAVPRDVEPEVASLPNVYLFDIDDLEQVTSRYRAEREQEVVRVEAIVDAETSRFMSWLRSRGAAPLIKQLRSRTERLRDDETERWLRKLPELAEEQQDVVRQMMRSFANKMLHAPTTNVRRIAAANDEQQLDVVRQLFELEGGDDEDDS